MTQEILKVWKKALLSLGQEVTVTAKQDEILGADKIVLPGVGAFGDAMENLRKRQLDAVIREAVEKEIPFLSLRLWYQFRQYLEYHALLRNAESCPRF